MSMTLATYKRDIDSTILGRGRRYYNDGHVIGLDELTATSWQAEVAGTYPYTVTIHIDDDDTLAWTCTCPYIDGPVCKHVAATLYAIEVALDPAAAPQPRKKRRTRADKVRAAIDPLSRDDLVALLVELANDDRQIAHLLLARYGAPEGGKAAAKRLVTDALSFGRDRHGFLDYRGAMDAGQAVSRLFDRAAGLLASGRTAEALLLYQAILEETVAAQQNADDSSGMLGECASFALEELETVAAQLSPADRAALFDYCVSDAMADLLAGWDWGWNLMELGGRLMTTAQQRATLFAALDRMASRNDADSWSSDYDRAHAAEIKLGVIEQQDGEAAVQTFLEDHVEFDRLRTRLVHFHLDRNNLEAARRICREWLDHPPAHKPGLRRGFLALLLQIAERAGDEAEQIRLLQELFLDTGDMTTYQRLKALVGPTAWPAYRPGLLARLDDRAGWSVNAGAVYAAEEMWTELMAFVRRRPHQATSWHHQLAGRFPQELAAIYEQQAAQQIGHSPNRTSYQHACEYLLRMREVDPAGAAAVVARWRIEHKHRPAMLDELNKAFGPANK